MKRYLLWLVVLCAGPGLSAQSVLDSRLSIQFENTTIVEALNQLIDERGVDLSFSDDLLPERLLDITFERRRLRDVLDHLLQNTSVGYRLRGNSISLYPLSARSDIYFTISGYLEDGNSGERLIGATVMDKYSGQGTVTNDYGFFSLRLQSGEVNLQFSYLGYQPIDRRIDLDRDHQFNVHMQPSLTLQEVLVLAGDSLYRPIVSEIGLRAGDVERMPRLAGEADPVRAFHLMPGVQTGTDGIQGLHVRGGSPGQNLILIDGVPVYYMAHAAGIFSIFNSDAIRSANLIKGGFPAPYGGRLSSVLDVRTKEGNSKQLAGSAELGLLSGRLSLEGPLLRDRSSFFIAGRWSYLDWYVRPFSQQLKRQNGEKGGVSYQFNDFNAKLNYSLDSRNKFYISYYQGKDAFVNGGRSTDTLTFQDQYGDIQSFRTFQGYYEDLNWSNQLGVLRWNHLFKNDQIFLNVAATFSELQVQSHYQLVDSIIHERSRQFISPFILADYYSNVRDAGLRADFDWYPHYRHRIRFGGSAHTKWYHPGALLLDNGQEDAFLNRRPRPERFTTQEYALYVDDEFDLGMGWRLYGGMHLALNAVKGRSYISAQPRLGVYGAIIPRLSIKASLSRMTQFTHLLSNSNLGLPTDLWVPSTADIRPEDAWQAVLGFDYKLGRQWDVNVEGYYKYMDKLLSFADGANLLSDWRRNVTSGQGWSRGVELLLRRKTKRTTAWLAYTLSYTDRQFDRVNFGNSYPYKFDRRHDLKLAFTHQLKPNWDISGSWIVSSGFRYSFPESQYRLNVPGEFNPPGGISVVNFGIKNDDRMPVYHRLDAGMNIHFGKGQIRHRVHVGVYNAYNRHNPLYYSFRTDYVNEEYELRQRQRYVQVRLLPVLPSLSYAIRM